MGTKAFEIFNIVESDKASIADFISSNWGSVISVSRGNVYNTTDLPGFICKDNDKIVGLVTYNIENKDCEIVTLDSKINGVGLGSLLINKVIDLAKTKNCRRVWLITTNDNTNAIKFYQKRGFEWAGFHKNAMIDSRKIKPEIPDFGNDNIPIKHEIEFEYLLD